jgi:hypothetical protein
MALGARVTWSRRTTSRLARRLRRTSRAGAKTDPGRRRRSRRSSRSPAGAAAAVAVRGVSRPKVLDRIHVAMVATTNVEGATVWRTIGNESAYDRLHADGLGWRRVFCPSGFRHPHVYRFAGSGAVAKVCVNEPGSAVHRSPTQSPTSGCFRWVRRGSPLAFDVADRKTRSSSLCLWRASSRDGSVPQMPSPANPRAHRT